MLFWLKVDGDLDVGVPQFGHELVVAQLGAVGEVVGETLGGAVGDTLGAEVGVTVGRVDGDPDGRSTGRAGHPPPRYRSDPAVGPFDAESVR